MAIVLLLIIVTVAVFWPISHYGFINYDDASYVFENNHVSEGLTWDGLIWAMTSFHASNWHPLTWLSHMADIELFGMNPHFHHLANLIFHAASVILLFIILKGMTGALWRSALVTAMFGVHPLHVESVAWIAERKDVLSTFCLMLTMGAYLLYVRKPNTLRYILVTLIYAAGLTAKPMLVTLPMVLLLLDFWPLERISSPWKREGRIDINRPYFRTLILLCLEKVPLLFLSVLSSVMTYFAQAKGRAMGSLETYSLSVRLMNAVISYMRYLWKTVFPINLAVFYPHPGASITLWQATLSFLALLGITSMVILLNRRKPYLAVGWFWFLGTLVPVIGLVQVGAQAIADRYTYVPLIGVFIILAWGMNDISAKCRGGYPWILTTVLLFLGILIILAGRQVRYWEDSYTLFSHTIESTSNNWLAEFHLGLALAERGMTAEAEEHYIKALKIRPGYQDAYNNLWLSTIKEGKIDPSIPYYLEETKRNPRSPEAHFKLGRALALNGKLDRATDYFRRALELRPDYIEAFMGLGAVMLDQNKLEEALQVLSRAVSLDPENADAHFLLGIALEQTEMKKEAVDHYRKAVELDPNDKRKRSKLDSYLLNPVINP